MQYISKPQIFPAPAKLIMKSYSTNGFLCMHAVYVKLHPKLWLITTTVCSSIQVQGSGSFETYKTVVIWYNWILAYIPNQVEDPAEVINIVAIKHSFPNETIKN